MEDKIVVAIDGRTSYPEARPICQGRVQAGRDELP